MQSLGSLLKKRSRSFVFQKALRHGELKTQVEAFFGKKKMPVFFEDYNEKKHLLTLRVSHPSLAQEVFFLQEKLFDWLSEKKLPSEYKIKVITRPSTSSEASKHIYTNRRPLLKRAPGTPRF